MVRVGVLGCGFIARHHARQLWRAGRDGHDVELVAYFDRDPARAEGLAGEVATTMAGLGRPRVAAEVGEVLAVVDAVFLCTWTSAHRELAALAAAAGCAVFCEKPLGTDLADAVAVAGDLRRCPVDMVGLVLRSSPAMLAVRELVADPAAGRLMNVVFRDDQYLPVDGLYGSRWRADPDRAGSGALLEHSIHDVDLLEWFGGPMATVGCLTAEFHGIAGIEDSVTATGRYAAGGSFSLSSVWHEVHDRPSQRRIEVFCERRLVTLEGDVLGPVRLQSDDETLELEGGGLVAWLEDRGVEVVSAEARFLDAVAARFRGDAAARPRPDATDALRAHEVLDAMYRSAAAGGAPIEVPSPVTPAGDGGSGVTARW
jgi:predicted dehydrogenase